ncbi:DoxX family protein [Pendulispora albinea]|uniref:DoxX family protein n=1 Tax=Pendulispora albinea TaxID=2741071 RepID=A0ABZ2M2G5_9BACT
MNHVAEVESVEAVVATKGRVKSFTRYLPATARVVLGLLLGVTGVNFFLQFIPQPATMPDDVVAFSVGLMKSGYIFPLIGITQTVVAALLLANRFVPLALALVAPVIVNIVGLHSSIDPSGLPMAIFVLVLEVYLAWTYRSAFRPMLAARVTAGAQ